jgi:exopolysaccharide production protein ExoZ
MHRIFFEVRPSRSLDTTVGFHHIDHVTKNSDQLVSIQVLRAVAALVVAFAHLPAQLGLLGVSEPFPSYILGASGVDLFFVISGFIMVYSSEPLYGKAASPATFIKRRLIRIVPLYWIATSYQLYAMLQVSRDLSFNNLTWTNVLGSYLFLPLLRPNGDTDPVLGVGWTLSYEMFFYVIFAVAVLLPRRFAVVAVTASFWAAINLPAYLGIAIHNPFTVWFGPTIYEFVFGMWIALAYREGLRIPAWLSGLLIAGGAALIFRTNYDGFATIGRVNGWGGGAAMIVTGFTLANVKPATARIWIALALLGDASYALYLLHGFSADFVAPALLHVSHHIPGLMHQVWLCAALLMVTAVVVALAVHLCFERPITKFLQRRLAAAPRTPLTEPQVSDAVAYRNTGN